MKIDKFEIGENRCFIIAEIGNNHNGSFDRAIEIKEAIIIFFIIGVLYSTYHYIVNLDFA